jgi:hypothetical protein
MGGVIEIEVEVCWRCTIMVDVELHWDRDFSAPGVYRLLSSCNTIGPDYGIS